ncbi:hypothetical protein IRI77_15190 [Paludibaculum fermentans]|uniref:Beta-glucuronidase C-terminal domain-containing protein n=2 Tax=Paludibaculum fermentans TaxID=1473598 RepID=A0A7S7NYA1_PALFE|nr:hypothetical protein IRI77_15190 [Paludibaculum fermentans]
MQRIGSVDERFQSFNVEMVEVTGGRFWAPYRKPSGAAAESAAAAPSVPGLDPTAFRMRQPIDLSNPRLRKLAAALGPAYVRVSGTWANSTYFHDADTPAPATPPTGFGGILTRGQWRGVVDFARASDARIITSFAVSDGVRDSHGVWTPDQARKFAAFTKAAGGRIAAAELFNEPNFAAIGGAPKGYDAAAYGRDFAAFKAFAKESLPEMIILGPGSVGEGALAATGFSGLSTKDILQATGRGVDGFSYHFYGGVSKRCGAMKGAPQTSPEAALTPEWLALTDREAAYYTKLRDQFEPGKPLWLTETGETACGGNPWAAGFLDTFRYLNQLGSLAKRGVQVVAHNTLAASDYALIDEETLTPRPSYWGALAWRKLMGTTVLEAGTSSSPDVHLYSHCLRGQPGGVAVLAINADRATAFELLTPLPSSRYELKADDLTGSAVQLNGRELKLGADDSLPAITGQPTAAGKIRLAPASITFLAFPNAGNASCR